MEKNKNLKTVKKIMKKYGVGGLALSDIKIYYKFIEIKIAP